jgi:type IV secretory pathway VirB9-like protein
MSRRTISSILRTPYPEVATIDGAKRATDAELLDPIADARFAPDAGGIDQNTRLAVYLEGCIQRVPCRPRGRVNYGTLKADKTIDQRGLADVRAPDHGDPHSRVLLFLSFDVFRLNGQMSDQVIQELPDSQSMFG